MRLSLNHFLTAIREIPSRIIQGRVALIKGLSIEIEGIQFYASIGDRCFVHNRMGGDVLCEVIGVREKSVVVMPFSSLDGVGRGCEATLILKDPVIRPSRSWLGRTLNALGQPVDGKGPLDDGNTPILIRNPPPSAHARGRVHGKIDLGVHALNVFTSCCKGQRMGIFAGSGVGKSSVISMMVRYTNLPIIVIGLIGERGRELQEFIQDDLGEDGLKRTVLVVSTSDESPLMRREAAYMTMAVAEYFRDQGEDVLCLMDSVTRFAMAQREIGLSAGEPPATKGYTPTVFVELPKLLERAGPGIRGDGGSITGLFTVLVEGDDHNEPISDAVRGILDGHIVLDRSIADRGRYPAVNILKSVSRTMPACNNSYENAVVKGAKSVITSYENMEELIRLGAYKKGSDPVVDRAIDLYPKINEFLTQRKDERGYLSEGYHRIADILGVLESDFS